MSTLAGSPAVTPAERPTAARRPHRPPLELVPPRPLAAAGRLPFVLLVGAVLVGGLLTLLLLHTLAAQDAFRLHDLQRQAAALSDTEQQLAVTVEQAQSPAQLAARAHQLGMVPTGSLAFIRLPDGRLMGVAHAATPPPPPPSPSPTPSASASARATASGAATRSGAVATAPKATTTGRPARSTATPTPAPTHQPAARHSGR